MTPLLLGRAWALLEAHWKAVAAVVAVCLSFVWGRSCAPTRAQEHVAYRDVVVEKRVEVQAAAEVRVQERVVYRDRTVIKHADGAEEHRDVEQTETGDTTAKAEVRYVDSVEYRDREVVKEKLVDRPLNWRVSALVGARVSLKPLGLGPVAYGAAVERRVLGPVFAGVWGLSTGEAGLSLGVVF